MSELIGETESLCPECLKVIPAKKIAENDNVYLEKTCPEHGHYKVLIWRGVDDYKSLGSYAPVPSKPEKVAEMQALLEKVISEGRSTPGAVQENDVEVIRFPRGEPNKPKKKKE